MDLQEQLLAQIVRDLGDIKSAQGAQSAKLDAMHNELLGNGKPGKIATIEADVAALKSAEDQRKGGKHVITAVVAFLSSLVAGASIHFHDFIHIAKK